MKRTEVHSESPTALRSTQNKIPTKGFKPLMGIQYGRDDRIRTCGILVPNQALYQTEPHPDDIFRFVLATEPAKSWNKAGLAVIEEVAYKTALVL